MNNKYTIFTLFLLFNMCCNTNTHAQKSLFGIPHTNHVHTNNIRQFYFLDVGFLGLSEYYRGMPNVKYTQTDPYETNEDLSNLLVGWTFFGVRLNQRLNLIEYNDVASLSLVIPTQLAIGLHGITLFTPITLQTNFFWQSTKTELDNYGFNLGIGYGKIRLIFTEDELRENFANVAPDKGFFLLNAGLTFKSSINNQPRRIDYWIGKRPTLISHSGDKSILANFYFSIAYTTRFLVR